MNDGVLTIAVTEAKAAAENETTLEGRLTAAMKATKNHWMATDEDTQFRAAIGAVLLLSEDEDKARLEEEVSQIKAVQAMLSGVPVDFDAMEPMENPIGLTKLWRELDEEPQRG
jgi:hypothetical protein